MELHDGGLDPNRYAGPLERTILLDSIQADTACLQTAADRLDHANATLHAAVVARIAAQGAEAAARLVQQRSTTAKHSIEQRLLEARGFLHPVRRLPPEILADIFALWSDGESSPLCTKWFLNFPEKARSLQAMPFTASSVCRRWRAVALDTRYIWSLVVLSFSTPPNAALWKTYIDTHRDRSGWGGLRRVAILCGTPEAFDSAAIQLVERVGRSAREFIAFFRDQYHPQVVKFLSEAGFVRSIRIECQQNFERQENAVEFPLPSGAALRTLVIDRAPISLVSGGQARRLSRVELSLARLTAEELTILRDNCPSLSTLQLLDIDELLGSEPPPNGVDWPELTHLYVKVQRTFAEEVARYFRFPNVRNLTIAPRDPYTTWTSFVMTSCPSVEKLWIDNLSLWSEDEALFVAELGQLDRVWCLTLDHTMLSRGLCEALEGDTSDDRVPFPRLELLDLVQTNVSRDFQVDHLERLEDSRRQALPTFDIAMTVNAYRNNEWEFEETDAFEAHLDDVLPDLEPWLKYPVFRRIPWT